jgi:hypothetical protein
VASQEKAAPKAKAPAKKPKKVVSDSDDDAEISDFEDAAPAQRVERAAPRRATAAKAISKYAEDSGSDDSDSGSD